jgi:hypothetical protein
MSSSTVRLSAMRSVGPFVSAGRHSPHNITDRLVTQSQLSVKPRFLIVFECCVGCLSIALAAYFWMVQ